MCACLQIMCAKIMSLDVCFKKIESRQSWRVCMMQHQNSRFFGVQFERRKVDKKSKPTRKLKHANSILEYFEYFCQMTSKSILIISSNTVSKFRRFFETQCRAILDFNEATDDGGSGISWTICI